MAIIEAWEAAMRVNAFFDDARQRIERLQEPDRTTHLARLTRARELLGSTDPMTHLMEWRTPEERRETAPGVWTRSDA
ncbi:MAG TPA: hypothetical protein VEL28_20515 [Candidatus Binatia bacterium]|nr:hypothetical protein [Candidatus Binatia bacterium]